MKTTEIEIQHCQIEGSKVEVDYTIYECDIAIEDKHETFTKGELIRFLEYKELNVYCSDEITGEYKSLNADTYLIENLDMVVSQYIESL